MNLLTDWLLIFVYFIFILFLFGISSLIFFLIGALISYSF